MKDRNESESVRQARILAKKTARAGSMSHQQALDQVARDRGHANWSAFLKAERPEESERPAESAPAPKRATTVQTVETRILESAANDVKVFPRWLVGLMPAIGATIYATLGTVFADWGNQSIVISLVPGLIVLALGMIAGDGRWWISIRTHLHRTGVFVGLPAIMFGSAILLVVILQHGLDVLLPGSRTAMTDVGGSMIGVGSFIRAIGMYGHRAMVLAAPETVRPDPEGPRFVEATPAVMSGSSAKVAMIAIGTFFAIMVVAVGFMMKELYDLTVTGAMDSGDMFTSVMVATAAGFLALLVSPVLDLAKPGRAMVIQDDRTRAARARRFLGIGRRGARS